MAYALARWLPKTKEQEDVCPHACFLVLQEGRMVAVEAAAKAAAGQVVQEEVMAGS